MVFFLLACNTLFYTDSYNTEQTVPSKLTEQDCPKNTVLKRKGSSYECLDPSTEKRHGPTLIVKDNFKELYHYNQDVLQQFPSFVSDGIEDNTKTAQYLHTDLSIAVMRDYLKRYPNSNHRQDLIARLLAKNQRKDHPYRTSSDRCTAKAADMTCLEATSGVQTLKYQKTIDTASIFFYQSYFSSRIYIDTHTVRKEDVIQCQKTCTCPTGEWNSPHVAQQYCHTLGKRLPNVGELLNYYEQKTVHSTGFELTRSIAKNEIFSHQVFHEMPKDCDNCTGAEKYAFVTLHKDGRYSPELHPYRFRCVTDTLPKESQYPILLTHKPTIPQRDVSFDSRSWADRDTRYQKQIHQSIPIAYRTLPHFDYGYKNLYMVRDLLWAYHQAYPEITAIYQLGTSIQGFPILALRISQNPTEMEKKPAVLINSSHHGDELLTVLFGLYNIDHTLRNQMEKSVEQWIRNTDMWFVPMVNPDGNWTALHNSGDSNTGRKNGRDTNGECSEHTYDEGVDLNRNYPFYWGKSFGGSSSYFGSEFYRGTKPASEPETQSLMLLAKQYRFVASISWHTNGTMIISPYTIPGIKNPSPDIPWDIAEKLAQQTPTQPNGRKLAVRRSMYTVDGTDQDWHYHNHGTIAYIVEGSHQNPMSLKTREASVKGLNPIFVGVMDRITQGPALYGSIVNDNLQPIEADVQIASFTRNSDEKWTSRPQDGFFFRVLPTEGDYILIIDAPGYERVQQKVEVLNNPVNLGNIVLDQPLSPN